MDSILLPTQFDIANVTFGNIKTLDNGGKTVYIGYNGKPLIIQTPEMSAPFGSSKWNPTGVSEAGKDKYTLEMSFKGQETRPYLQTFGKLLDSFDERIVEAGLENSANWFKKKYNSVDVVAALYTPMLKRSKNKDTGEVDDKYPPTFRINLPFKNEKFDCEIYNKEKQALSLSSIDKGSKVTAILQCLGLWVAGGKFGCSWKVLQLRVVAPEAIRGFAFQDIEPQANVPNVIDDVDEDDIDDSLVKEDMPTVADPVVVPATQMVESSDDEDDDPIEQKKEVSVPVKKAPPPKKGSKK